MVTYYASKNQITRIRQKSADLRHVINTALERNRKKYDLQLRQLKDTEKRDKYRIYGELINTYGYGVEEGAKSMEAFNYYTNETIQIPLKDTLSAKENAQKYFDRYNKLKRTFEALNELTRGDPSGDPVSGIHRKCPGYRPSGGRSDSVKGRTCTDRIYPPQKRSEKGQNHQQAFPLYF